MCSNSENDIILTFKLVKILHVRSGIRTHAWKNRLRPERKRLRPLGHPDLMLNVTLNML